MLWLHPLTVCREQTDRASKRGYIKMVDTRGGSYCECCQQSSPPTATSAPASALEPSLGDYNLPCSTA